jgi:hypothetical protein
MLRVILAAFFLLAFSVPSFAHNPWSCSWCRAGHSAASSAPLHGGVYIDDPRAVAVATQPEAAPFSGGLSGPLAVSVIYPGVIVLMTMTAYFFLRVMEPQGPRENPYFIRNTAVLSALWLIGFYPFLSSALGGFLFCVTALSCVGGWFVVRHYGLQMRGWERAVVLWSFFFFSLLTGVIATGYGRSIGGVFDGFARFGEAVSLNFGPLLLFAVNGGALMLVFRMTGVRIPRPTEPASILRLKVYSTIVAVAIFDTYVTETRSFSAQWLFWLPLALPSVAYYGLYWVVSRLPDQLRLRAGAVLFVGLALFLLLLACLAQGAPVAGMLLAAAALVHAAALAFGLIILWRSDVAYALKAVLTTAVAAFVFAAGFVTLGLETLGPDDRDAFIRDRLLLDLLTPRTAMLLALACAYAAYFVISPRFSPRAKQALAAVALSFLLLLHAGENHAVSAAFGKRQVAAVEDDMGYRNWK